MNRDVSLVVKIITANADRDALVIPGTALDSEMGDEIRVTVIATGFTSEHVYMAEEVEEEEDQDEIIKYSDWIKMREGIVRKTPNEYLLGRNAEDSDLGIPTILRDKRVPEQGEM